jgi:hypothetical protein
MGVIFTPKRTAMVLLIILGIICLADGIHKKDTTETLVAMAILLYAIISLINGRKKPMIRDNQRSNQSNITGI